MSWDIFVQDIPSDVKQIGDMRDRHRDFKPSPIGARSEIIKRIKAVLPEADFSNPAWGVIDGEGFSIEANMGDAEECRGFALHVRGGDAAAYVVSEIIESLGLRAFDPSSAKGLFEIGLDAAAGLEQWRRYRRRVVPPRDK